MDEKGFLFTTDAVLALVVVIVLTASIVTYGLLPIYQGQNHQHLEAIADSALETMEQDGTLRQAAVQYANNNTTGAQTLITNELNNIIPTSVGYKLTMDPYGSVSNSNGVLTSNDVATKVKVISAPSEGWMGRAYYKQDEIQFQDITGTQVTTVWNFHNYLTNFAPWNNSLSSYGYWASPLKTNTSQAISFTIPTTGTINSAKFLLGAAAGNANQGNIYNADVVINGVNHYTIANTSFTYLYNSQGVGLVYNYPGTITTSNLVNGVNNFYIKYNGSMIKNKVVYNMTMPWFSLIASYSNTLHVPKGIANDTIAFPEIAGIGNPNYSLTYNLNTGSTSQSTSKSYNWTKVYNTDFDTSTPFILTDIPQTNGNGKSGVGSAVASVQNINFPAGNKLFDAYTVINAFGGEDGVVVQVKNSTGIWNTIFTSWNTTGISNTNRSDGGYGNVPGIINILPYITSGTNTVRIITWDNANGNDYDLVGLTNCYSTITYSKFPIRWDTIPFANAQNTTTAAKNSTETQQQTFKIDTDAQSAFLFVGVGLDTRSITVTANNSTGGSGQIYSGSVPYYIDLGPNDASHIMTFTNGTVKPGIYTLTVKVTPSAAYESGDGASTPPNYGNSADPEIFSGTRISVIYPKFLENVWAVGYASNSTQASLNAIANLKQTLTDAGYSYDPSLIRNNTLWTGDVPNSIPVRLDLYEQ